MVDETVAAMTGAEVLYILGYSDDHPISKDLREIAEKEQISLSRAIRNAIEQDWVRRKADEIRKATV